MRYHASCPVLLLAGVIACSSESDDPIQPPPPIALSQSIGPAGGTLSSTDGRISLSIPAGALAQTVDITVNETANPPIPAVPGAAFEFGPTGTEFAIPASLVIRYDPTRLRQGTSENNLILGKQRPDQSWEVERSSLDVAANRLSGEISTFSTHAVAVGVPIPPPAVEVEYQPGRTADITTSGIVAGEIAIEVARNSALTPPGTSAFTQFGPFQNLGATVTYPFDGTAGVYWFRARYRWVDASVTWYGNATDPAVRVIVFGLPDRPDRATTFTATAIDPGTIDLNFAFPSPGQNNIPSGYRLRRFVTGSPAEVLFDLPLGQALPYRDAGLSPDTDYNYSLTAFNEAGEGPAFSASARTPPLPATACRAYTIALATPPGSVNRGATASTSVNVTRLGFNGPITLALAGTGTAVVENVVITQPGVGSTGDLQFKVKSDAPVGPAAFTLNATSGSEFCPLNFQVDVQQPPAPVVSKLTARPGAVSLTPNTSSAVWLGNPGSTPLHLTAGVPTGAGITVDFVPANLGAGAAVVIVRAGATIVPGVYTVTITGTGPGETRTASISVSLTALADFSISMASPLAWTHDQSALHTGTLNRAAGFVSPVTMSVPDLPAGVSAGFDPAVLTADPPTPISWGIHVFPAAAPGLHIMNLTGTAGATVRAMQLLAIIGGQTGVPGRLTLIPESQVSLNRMSNPPSVQVIIVIARPAALAGAPMTLSLTGLPQGVQAAFVSNPATANGIVTLTASPTAVVGEHLLTLTATGGPEAVTAPIRLVVTGFQP